MPAATRIGRQLLCQRRQPTTYARTTGTAGHCMQQPPANNQVENGHGCLALKHGAFLDRQVHVLGLFGRVDLEGALKNEFLVVEIKGNLVGVLFELRHRFLAFLVRDPLALQLGQVAFGISAGGQVG